MSQAFADIATVRLLRERVGCGLRDALDALICHPEIDDATEHLRTLDLAVVVRGPVPACGSHTCEVEKRRTK